MILKPSDALEKISYNQFVHTFIFIMAASGVGAGSPVGTQELTTFVQNLLQQMQGRFQEMSDTIITRIDEMGSRIDELERCISELMQQAGVEEGDTRDARPLMTSSYSGGSTYPGGGGSSYTGGPTQQYSNTTTTYHSTVGPSSASTMTF